MKRTLGPGALLPLAVGLVMLVHALPHLPGESTGPVGLAERAGDGFEGGTPYPLHVDEHIHMAWMAQMDRQQEIDIVNPYTGEPYPNSLFSITGLRQERGFTTAITQIHHLTDLDLPALFRFLPAIQAGVLATAVWVALRPHASAVPAAALVAIIPTTVRFLGPGFLIPSSFALVWLVTILAVAQKATGGRRFVALVMLITGATAMHIVLGTLAIVTAIASTLVRRAPWRDRLELLAASLVPLLWILPALWADAVSAVASAHQLPFNTEIFLRPGWLLIALAAVGTFRAWRPQGSEAHRAITLVALFVMALMAASILLVHRNDATYSRVLPTWFLCIGILAAEPIGSALAWLARKAPNPRPAGIAMSIAGIIAVLAVAMPAINAQMQEPIYRVFDEDSWARAEAFAASGAGPEDVFLSEPWQAPVFNALTGAKPHAVLYPGNPPVNDADFKHYVNSNGASAEWLASRGITYVVDPAPPAAPHHQEGIGIFAVDSADRP